MVKERLTTLLAALGELPGPGLLLPGEGLARIVDDICPAGAMVVRSKSLPGCALALERLVVGPRGVVVVSTEWVPPRSKMNVGAPGALRSACTAATSAQDRRRSRVVREALRRARALHAWLDGTAWAGVPVWAAVCLPPLGAPVPPPPVVIDGLWVGPIERLPAWLASGPELDSSSRAALGCFLNSELSPA